MPLFQKLHIPSRTALLSLCLLPMATAVAEPVTVSGGFTAYLGPAISIPSLTISTRLTPTVGGVVQPGLTVLPTIPIPGRPPTIGLGTADFTAGGAQPAGAEAVDFINLNLGNNILNRIAFTPGPAVNVAVGDEFLLGTFSFVNGDWFGGLPDSEFSFRLVTSSTEPALHNQVFAGTFGFLVTSGCESGTCSDDPVANADIFYIKERPDLGGVGLFEPNAGPGFSNTGSVSLYGRIGSLVPTRFADLTGGALLLPYPPLAVPEPASWLLLTAGLGLAFLRGRMGRPPAG